MSFIVMGASNIARGQIVKGISYLVLELSFIFYLIWRGIDDLAGLATLGTKEQEMVYNEAKGIYEVVKGDNSMIMLLLGITAIFVVAFFAIVWKANLKSAIAAQEYKASGKKVPGIIDDIRSLFDSNLHKLLLSIPIIGLIITTVLPLFYMILMAFTNYNMTHQPPGKLFTWVGLENFRIMLMSADKLGYTFWRIFEWTLIWAVMATFSNYFLGMFLAILINSKGIKGKGFWRTIFVISVAVPSFVTLLVIRIMMNDHGALNILLMELGFTSKSIPFFTNPDIARITVILVNLWIGIPHTMLITTGILVNIPSELYESARIDGAGPVKSFLHITMPYMIFITTPYLITNFIFNINNFNAIYFLTGGGPSTLEYFKGAGKTDLLVTWLYRLTVESWDYCYAATIGIVIFLISAAGSLIVYRKSASYRKEEEFSNG
ncbi:MAG TPA: sugar ABC transporter permease [Clostridiaceae bacterium]|nr:sugar ABC transporter permease [Clostridiaceae bacterium]